MTEGTSGACRFVPIDGIVNARIRAAPRRLRVAARHGLGC